MAKLNEFDDFDVGDHVDHVARGHGDVIAITPCIEVAFREGGENGIFSRTWFSGFPTALKLANNCPNSKKRAMR